MNNLVYFCINRCRAVVFALCVIMALGSVTYNSIPRESEPEITIPMVYVLMTYQGVSPEDGQRLLLRPMENALRSIKGIKKMTSYAQDGAANIVVEFFAGLDIDKVLEEVRAKVNYAEHKLPKDANRPIIKEVDLSLEPVLNVILMGDIPERSIINIARSLRDKLEGVDGVLEINIGGDREEAIEIVVEPAILARYGLSTQLLTQITTSNNKVVAAGNIENKGGQYSIKVPGIIEGLQTLQNFPVKADRNGILRLKDIAIIRKTYKDPDIIARVNSKPAVVLEITKRSGANIIETVASVKKVVESEQESWPNTLQVMYSQDKSTEIQDMVTELENSLIIAGILVIIIIVLSVGVRSALLIALSLPFSFFAGVMVLYMLGFTLNGVVLFSLILTVGMIVDDAIVVSEYADRKMIDGGGSSQAFFEAATRMFWPVMTSTIVKIAVFLPLLFWPGVMGEFMKFMPITVVAILTSSLLFALFFQPALGALLGKFASIVGKEEVEAMKVSERGAWSNLRLTARYVELLSKVLDKPGLFVAVVCICMVIVYLFFFCFGTGLEFFPKIEPTTATISIGAPGNLSLHQKDDLLKEVENKILDLSKDIKIFYAKSGKVNDKDILPEDTIGIVQLELQEWKKRRKAAAIWKDIQSRLAEVQGITFQILETREGPASQKPIEINFTADNYDLLPPFVERFRAAMVEMNDFKDVEDSRSVPAIEWDLVFDRETAAKYMVDVGMLGSMIQVVTNGLKLSSYRPDDADNEVDIILRFPEEKRLLSVLDNLVIVTNSGESVPICNFVKRIAKPKVAKLKRIDRKHVITVKANVQPGVIVDNKMHQIKQWIAANLELGISVQYAGDDAEQAESATFLVGSFSIALLMMFLVMLIQFNNLYSTFIVMSAVFLSTVGVLLGLIISWQPFGVVMCGIGVIALAGIVLNNNILFVDTYQYLRKEGHNVREAIILAGAQRMRSILLTATTAVLGLLPMVLGLSFNLYNRSVVHDSPASQWWRQLSISIAGGLSFATILTLFFTPCLLLLCKRFDKYDK